MNATSTHRKPTSLNLSAELESAHPEANTMQAEASVPSRKLVIKAGIRAGKGGGGIDYGPA